MDSPHVVYIFNWWTCGLFHFLAIIDNAAMNICIQFKYLRVFSFLGYKPRSGVAESDASSMFIGFRNCQTVFQTVSLILHSYQHCLSVAVSP